MRGRRGGSPWMKEGAIEKKASSWRTTGTAVAGSPIADGIVLILRGTSLDQRHVVAMLSVMFHKFVVVQGRDGRGSATYAEIGYSDVKTKRPLFYEGKVCSTFKRFRVITSSLTNLWMESS
ncbi:hypothetical protein EJB05_14512, partial [Eragrostis curvula]